MESRTRPESPIKRKGKDGRVTWVARYTNPRTGRREIAKPEWNRRKGTFARKADAQRAIIEAYGFDRDGETVGEYAERWLERHPRAERTNTSYRLRFDAVADVEIDGRPFRDWRFADLRRRHALDLIDHLLREQGRAAKGATGVIRVLSAMAEDAITDEVTEVNAFRRLIVKADDPRVQKKAREPQVWTVEEMRRFAAAAPKGSEALIRFLSDCGMRIGEVFALAREDYNRRDQVVRIHRTAHEGRITEGLKGKRGGGEERFAPVPDSLAELLEDRPIRIDSDLLFPTPRGSVWRYRNFIRDVWDPARKATGLDPTPHDFRHSFVSEMRAAGINDDDLAAITGHTVTTMLQHYSHPLGRSFDDVRRALA
jgi:integrase